MIVSGKSSSLTRRAAAIFFSNERLPAMRSLSGALGALDRDLDVIEPGCLQRLRALAREQGPGGDQRRVQSRVARARAQRHEITAQHRLSAGERELQDAELSRLTECGSGPGLQL